MGADSLKDSFYEDMEDVVIIAVRSDKTIDIQTSVENLEEMQSILSTALMMTTFHKVKRRNLDNMH